MIDWLQIRHFAIAEQVDLEFDNGFTTVTGETGSGKSIIVDAIGLLLGDRADNGVIKHGQPSADLQIGFALPEKHPALEWLTEQSLGNEGECVLRRTIRRDKSSRAYINGYAVTVSQLRELGKELVDIHGQNEHHSLLRRQTQQNLLDTVAGNEDELHKLGAVYEQLNELQDQIDHLNSESHSSQERADLLRFQIEELETLGPTAEEWDYLEINQKKAHHLQELISGTQWVADQLYEAEQNSANSLLLQSQSRLEQLSQFDPSLKTIAQMLQEASVNVEEAAKQLRPFYESNTMDEEELVRIEQRFSSYHHLGRKHRIQPAQLGEQLENMQNELSKIKDPEAELERLSAMKETAAAEYDVIAKAISVKRKKIAKQLAKEVTAAMQELGMQGGAFDIELQPTEAETFTRYGRESVEFIVTANAGQPLSSLNKVASGGELSRISLAIQVILAKKARIPTLIFDEVDVGIGGSVADTVGKKLYDLGRSTQVICITHLSQVAAKGDQQFSVSKTGKDAVNSEVTRLNEKQRIEEIARMTGGANLTPQSLAHAEEMLKSA